MAGSTRLKPVHRTILAFDIEGFGGPQRSNPVRTVMRMALFELIKGSLGRALGGLGQCRLSDLGDGVLVIIDAEVSKTQVVEPFMGDMALGLKRYNAQAGTNAQIRLRTALHAGEIIEDSEGYSGQDLNLAFRLLDCVALRAALSRRRADLGLIVSEHFYETIIGQGFEGIDPADYVQVDVDNKETKTTGWIHLPVPRDEVDARDGPAATSPRPAAAGRRWAPMPVQKPIDIEDLPPTCLYVSTADVHNGNLYALHDGTVPLRNHLETALLLGRHAVVHCIDPYWSEDAARLIAEFREFVKDGSLLFLLSGLVTNPRRDFAAYLDQRLRESGRSRYGSPDAAAIHVPDPRAARRRTIELLELSPFALRRGYSARLAFTRAVREDLDVDERIVVCEPYAASRIRDLSLSLRQILTLSEVKPAGGQRRLLADDATVGSLQHKIAELTADDTLSKQMLLGLIAEELGLDERSPFYEVLAARISVVHLMATIGNLSFIEVTRGRDRVSPYYYRHLLDHLGVLVDCPPRRELGVKLVDELRRQEWWRFFANYHLRLMADLRARRDSGDHDPDPHVMFEGSRLITQFDDIRDVIRTAWEA